MKYSLILDTTNTKQIMVGLTRGDIKLSKLIQSQTVGSQVLLPMIDTILKKYKLKITDIGSIQVNPGPGSFTGTRVGVSVANALGCALNIPVNGKREKIVQPIYDKSKFDY